MSTGTQIADLAMSLHRRHQEKLDAVAKARFKEESEHRERRKKAKSDARVFNALRAILFVFEELKKANPQLAEEMSRRQGRVRYLEQRIRFRVTKNKPYRRIAASFLQPIPAKQVEALRSRYVAIYQELACAIREEGHGEWLATLRPATESHRLAVQLASARAVDIAGIITTYMVNATGIELLARANFEGLWWLDWAFQAYLKGLPLPPEDIWHAKPDDVVAAPSAVATAVDSNSPPQTPLHPIQLFHTNDSTKVACLNSNGTWSEPAVISEREANVLQALLEQFSKDPNSRLSGPELHENSGETEAHKVLTELQRRIPAFAPLIARPGGRGKHGGYGLQFAPPEQTT